jgi:hypothetical protein
MSDDRDKMDLLPPQLRPAPAASEAPAASPIPAPPPPAESLSTDTLPPSLVGAVPTSDWPQFTGIESDQVPHHISAAQKAQRRTQKNAVLFGVCIVVLVIVFYFLTR